MLANIYAIFSLSWNIIQGYASQVSLAMLYSLSFSLSISLTTLYGIIFHSTSILLLQTISHIVCIKCANRSSISESWRKYILFIDERHLGAHINFHWTLSYILATIYWGIIVTLSLLDNLALIPPRNSMFWPLSVMIVPAFNVTPIIFVFLDNHPW